MCTNEKYTKEGVLPKVLLDYCRRDIVKSWNVPSSDNGYQKYVHTGPRAVAAFRKGLASIALANF